VVVIDISAIAVGIGIIWVDPDRLVVICKRLVIIAFTFVRDTSIIVGTIINWADSDDLGKFADRFVIIQSACHRRFVSEGLELFVQTFPETKVLISTEDQQLIDKYRTSLR
jgi:hypothetical protein